MSPLDRARKPGFSPDTSVFSALETFVIMALYKLTFTIPYHIVTYRHTFVSTFSSRTTFSLNRVRRLSSGGGDVKAAALVPSGGTLNSTEVGLASRTHEC